MREIEVRFVVRRKNGFLKLKAGFHLPIDDGDENILFGAFLAKYGEFILKSFHRKIDLGEWESNKGVFPVKVSVKFYNDFDNDIVFDSDTKDTSMSSVFSREQLVFVVESFTQDEKEHLTENVIIQPQTSRFVQLGRDYTRVERVEEEVGGRVEEEDIDPEEVLNVKICYLDSRKGRSNAVFSFLKKDVEGISHGIFLLRYGKDILEVFRNDRENIPPYPHNPKDYSFPMELKFVEAYEMGGSFDNYNRDRYITWFKDSESVLILRKIPDLSTDFNQAITDPAEDSPECLYCCGSLFQEVFAFDTRCSEAEGNIKLPRLRHDDITEFPCGHKFHTHCVLKSFAHKFYKCIRCTRDPGDAWLKERFRSVERSVYIYGVGIELENLRRELNSKTYKFENLIKKQETYEDPVIFQAKKLALERRIFEIKTQQSNLNLVQRIVDKEYAFVIEKNSKPQFIRSRYRNDSIPNPNGFQRLNLLLARHI
jgi:hypothetical protein